MLEAHTSKDGLSNVRVCKSGRELTPTRDARSIRIVADRVADLDAIGPGPYRVRPGYDLGQPIPLEGIEALGAPRVEAPDQAAEVAELRAEVAELREALASGAVDELQAEVAELRAEVAELRETLAAVGVVRSEAVEAAPGATVEVKVGEG